MDKSILAHIMDLSPSERIRLAQDIWDSVSEIPNSEALTDWQKSELKKRLKSFEANPNQGIPWRDVLAEIQGK